jgi:hypothetical protein
VPGALQKVVVISDRLNDHESEFKARQQDFFMQIFIV